jgi:hypothetical protein
MQTVARSDKQTMLKLVMLFGIFVMALIAFSGGRAFPALAYADASRLPDTNNTNFPARQYIKA